MKNDFNYSDSGDNPLYVCNNIENKKILNNKQTPFSFKICLYWFESNFKGVFQSILKISKIVRLEENTSNWVFYVRCHIAREKKIDKMSCIIKCSITCRFLPFLLRCFYFFSKQIYSKFITVHFKVTIFLPAYLLLLTLVNNFFLKSLLTLRC